MTVPHRTLARRVFVLESPRVVAGSRRGRALAALLSVAVAGSSGCMYGADDTLDTVVQPLNSNSRAVYDYFVGKGLTPVQAAGIVGNLMQESNCSPTAVQPGGPGRGIAQWSVGGRWDRDAGDNAVAFASSRGASVWSLSLQLDFIWHELTTFSRYGLAQLRAATTVTAATVAFEARFEGCGTCVQTQRVNYANQALAAYGSSTWGASFVSQSFPYASTGSVNLVAGRSAAVSITLRNSGTHAWDAHTCLATTGPRDRRSVFAGSEWPGANRPACVAAGRTVASGASYTFAWTMHAPAAAGRYDEHWGVVEDGVTWFSASGQGGPPDDQLEGIFVVTAAPPPADAGVRDAGARDVVVSDAGARDAGARDTGTRDAGVSDDVARDDVVIDDVSSDDDAAVPDDVVIDDVSSDDDAVIVDDVATADGDETTVAPMPGGCACAVASPRDTGSRGLVVLGALAMVGAGTRRRRATRPR